MTGDLFGPALKNGAFVGQHGSWNRKPRSGYKVIFVPFSSGKPSGPAPRYSDRVSQRRRQSAWPAGWRRHRPQRRLAGCRRRRQQDLAGRACRGELQLDQGAGLHASFKPVWLNGSGEVVCERASRADIHCAACGVESGSAARKMQSIRSCSRNGLVRSATSLGRSASELASA